MTGNGTLLSLHTTNPAFTITTGWGNTIPHKGHWSFPVRSGRGPDRRAVVESEPGRMGLL